MQKSSGGFSVSKQEAFETTSLPEDMDALFFDADNDGDKDLYVVSGGYAFMKNDKVLQDRLYFNENGQCTVNSNVFSNSFHFSVRPCDNERINS